MGSDASSNEDLLALAVAYLLLIWEMQKKIIFCQNFALITCALLMETFIPC